MTLDRKRREAGERREKLKKMRECEGLVWKCVECAMKKSDLSMRKKHDQNEKLVKRVIEEVLYEGIDEVERLGRDNELEKIQGEVEG